MERKPEIEKVERESADVNAERVAQLRGLFPEAFTEGKVDFERLREALGDAVDERPERYSFSWAGKQDAIRILQMPTSATLTPAPEESIEWETTENVFIEGDNLEVLKLLYKPYFGKVKMIYIDPPYNTGNDFIYPDNYADPLEPYLQLTGQIDSEGNILTSNTELSGRYHSSWLTMMYPRLFLARQLLREDGAIFVSIDDNEFFNLRTILNEVFGEENFVTTICWQKMYTVKNTAKHFSEMHDYVLVYAKDINGWQNNFLPRTKEQDSAYTNPDNDPRGPWTTNALQARNYYSKGRYSIVSPSGRVIKGPPSGTYWRISEESFEKLNSEGKIWWGMSGDGIPRVKRYLSDVGGVVPSTMWFYKEVGTTASAKDELRKYVNFNHSENMLHSVKPIDLMRRIIQLGSSPNDDDLILDFFAGSAPLAQAVYEQNRADSGNRHFIAVQIPEPLPKPEDVLATLADIGKERLKNATRAMQESDDGKLELLPNEDLGFRVFELAPSNFLAWEGTADADAEEYAEQMELFTDTLVDGWKVDDVVFEIAIKEGFPLTSRVERAAVGGKKVVKVTNPESGQNFYVCLDDAVSADLAAALELDEEDLLVCRDSALDDTTAANLALQCRLKTV